MTPHINPDGLVILDVSPTISQLSDRNLQLSERLSLPVINKRFAESRVGVMGGQTIVIGGLMEDQKTSTVEKVPLLGDLPLFGPVFSRTKHSKRKTELLIFLTPHVAQEPESLRPMSKDEMKGTKLTPEAIGPGVFKEHMQGLERGEAPASTRPARPATQIYRPGAASRPAQTQPGDAETGPDGKPVRRTRSFRAGQSAAKPDAQPPAQPAKIPATQPAAGGVGE